MNIMQFKSLLKSMYEETKQSDPIVANVYIETGWAAIDCWTITSYRLSMITTELKRKS